MVKVFIPASIRSLASGQEVVEVSAATVREAITALDRQYPGIAGFLCQDNELKTGWCVAVGGSVASLGLLTRVSDSSEIHFLPVVGGG